MKRYGKQLGVVSRECSGCGGDLANRHGKQRYCKSCHAAWMRKHRPKHSELSENARLRANARSLSRYYFTRGIIKKTLCADCGSTESQRHHEDYTKPLDVIWLCRSCHLKRHQSQTHGLGLPSLNSLKSKMVAQ